MADGVVSLVTVCTIQNLFVASNQVLDCELYIGSCLGGHLPMKFLFVFLTTSLYSIKLRSNLDFYFATSLLLVVVNNINIFADIL